MKKILLIVLLLSFSNVQAMEYSDYTEFSDFTDQYIESDDLTDVKVERRYKYYKLEKVLGDYSVETTDEYPYFDKDDYKYTDYSSFSEDKPEDKEGRITDSKTSYKYKKIKDPNLINISASMADSTIKNLKIFYNNEEINYELTEGIDAKEFTIKANKSISIAFKEKYDLRFLKMTFDITSSNGVSAFLNIVTSTDGVNLTKDVPVYKHGSSVTWLGNQSGVIVKDDIWDTYYSDTKLSTSSILRYDRETTLYRYKDILYRTYNLTRDYYDEYLNAPYEDYIYKDEMDYKDYYAKRTRTIIDTEPKISETDSEDIENNNVINDNIVSEVIPEVALPDLKKESNQVPKAKTLDNIIYSKTVTSSNNLTRPNYNYSNYYPVKVTKTVEKTPDMTFRLIYIIWPWFLILVILILVLSKLYKKRKECAKVKLG